MEYMFMNSIAPDETLLTVGLKGHLFFSFTKMFLKPIKKADHKIAPKF